MAYHIVPNALLVRVQYFRKGLHKAVEGPSTRPKTSRRSMGHTVVVEGV